MGCDSSKGSLPLDGVPTAPAQWRGHILPWGGEGRGGTFPTRMNFQGVRKRPGRESCGCQMEAGAVRLMLGQSLSSQPWLVLCGEGAWGRLGPQEQLAWRAGSDSGGWRPETQTASRFHCRLRAALHPLPGLHPGAVLAASSTPCPPAPTSWARGSVHRRDGASQTSAAPPSSLELARWRQGSRVEPSPPPRCQAWGRIHGWSLRY